MLHRHSIFHHEIDASKWAPLLITIGPQLSGKSSYIHSLGEKVVEVSIEDTPGLYEKVPIAEAVGVWSLQHSGDVKFTVYGHTLAERLVAYRGSEHMYLGLLFDRKITLEEFKKHMDNHLNEEELHLYSSAVEEVLNSSTNHKFECTHIDLFIEEAVHDVREHAVKTLKHAIKTEHGLVAWGNCNLLPDYYKDVLQMAVKYRRVVRFIRQGQELPAIPLHDLIKRNVLKYLKTGRYIETRKLLNFYKHAEKIKEQNHDDMTQVHYAYNAGFTMDEHGLLTEGVTVPPAKVTAPADAGVIETTRPESAVAVSGAAVWNKWSNEGVLTAAGSVSHESHVTNNHAASEEHHMKISTFSSTTTSTRSVTTSSHKSLHHHHSHRHQIGETFESSSTVETSTSSQSATFHSEKSSVSLNGIDDEFNSTLAIKDDADVEEAARVAELVKAEELRLAEEARQAEEAAHLAELARIDEEHRLAEEARVVEEARLAEVARAAAEARRIEAARIAEEVRLAEVARLAEEVRIHELEGLAEAERLAAAARSAEAARLAEEPRLAEEARVNEEERLAEEARVAESARRAAEAKAGEDEKRAAQLKKWPSGPQYAAGAGKQREVVTLRHVNDVDPVTGTVLYTHIKEEEDEIRQHTHDAKLLPSVSLRKVSVGDLSAKQQSLHLEAPKVALRSVSGTDLCTPTSVSNLLTPKVHLRHVDDLTLVPGEEEHAHLEN